MLFFYYFSMKSVTSFNIESDEFLKSESNFNIPSTLLVISLPFFLGKLNCFFPNYLELILDALFSIDLIFTLIVLSVSFLIKFFFKFYFFGK